MEDIKLNNFNNQLGDKCFQNKIEQQRFNYGKTQPLQIYVQERYIYIYVQINNQKYIDVYNKDFSKVTSLSNH